MTRVGATAIGVCTPLGRSLDELWGRIAAGEHGFREVDRFELPDLPMRWASAFDGPTTAAICTEAGVPDPALAFAVCAARDALCGLQDRDGIALVAATGSGTAESHDAYDRARARLSPTAAAEAVGGRFASFPRMLAEVVGLDGPRTCASTACASGGHALGLGIDLVRSGWARRVLVVGAESVHPSLFAGFHSVGALAPEPCRPFGPIFGMSLGEGAGAVLLEADPVEPLAWFPGWGGSCDAYHPTAPDPRGAGMARGLRDALADAGLQPSEVGAFNAHGTGTEANDPAETFAVQAVLGEVPVSATKSQLGHTQGAAGILEAIVTVAALRAGAVPPSLGSEPHRRVAPTDTVGDRARLQAFDTALSHSAAFGGTNVAIAVSSRPRSRALEPRAVYASGLGVVGFDTELATAEPIRVRRADPASTLLTQAVAAALDRARIRGPADDVALMVAMADGPQQSIRRFVESRDRRGLAKASASAFARMVHNAPAGTAASTTQVRGPNLTLWSGHGTGAHAVLLGALMLTEHPTLRAVVAAGADEIGTTTADRHAATELPGEPIAAAAALVLTTEPGDALLMGHAWGSVTEVDTLIERATAGRSVDRRVYSTDPGSVPEGVFHVDRTLGHAPAASGVLASALAVHWIRSGDAGSVLVVSNAVDSGCTVLLWSRREDA